MRNIHFTREGRRFLIAVVLIGFASVNTGNNLIYLIFSMMLSISFISFIIALINLRNLKCAINFKEPVFANMPFEVDISINNKKLIPSYSVTVVSPVKLTKELYFPIIKSGNNRKIFDDVVINRRGKYSLKDIKIKTGFPFIFMYVNKTLDRGKDLIAYPQIVDASSFLENIHPRFSDRAIEKIGREGDFLFTREYVYGEESRHIDWKATAKIQKTMVREFSRSDQQLATVILDNSGCAEDETFEKAVSVAASLCSELIGRDYYVRLLTCGKVIPFGNGRAHLFKMLDILAAVQQMNVAKCPIDESIDGLNILVMCSDRSIFSQIVPFCTGVIDARNL